MVPCAGQMAFTRQRATKAILDRLVISTAAASTSRNNLISVTHQSRLPFKPGPMVQLVPGRLPYPLVPGRLYSLVPVNGMNRDQ